MFSVSRDVTPRQINKALLIADGTTEEADIVHRIVRMCSPWPTYTYGCRDIPMDIDKGPMVAVIKGHLFNVLGYAYTGEVSISRYRATVCEKCCQNNTNTWSADHNTQATYLKMEDE